MPIRCTCLRDKDEIVFGGTFARGLKLAIKGCSRIRRAANSGIAERWGRRIGWRTRDRSHVDSPSVSRTFSMLH
jgi:hypothetical protein